MEWNLQDGYCRSYARDPDPEVPNAIANYIKGDVAAILSQIFRSGQGVPNSWLN